MQVTTDSYTDSIAGAVRAELARSNKRFIDIAPVLHISRATAYRRITGLTPFDVSELEKIANFLGISVQDIFDSAEYARQRAERAA